jgi:pyridinium-3,5-bisthiocarboxylic acid mononucleotide nickel chelatase
MRHIHLDPLGGIAGDMFVAALLDAEPAHAAACLRAAEAASGLPCRIERAQDHALAGTRFVVPEPPDIHGHTHEHTPWRTIRARLHAADLDAATRQHALGIFAVLAQAEGRVHGIAPDEVEFHEVGAADSLADIAAAAALIAAQGEATWSCAPLPLGSGRVMTAHGSLPVPAPAVAVLLEGFAVHDDGIGGERVTPTGAAILHHLGAMGAVPPGARVLRASGAGLGTRRLPGIANALRALISDDGATALGFDEVAVLAFEIDDQSGEDLAIGLDRLRALAGVRDVLQVPAFGKKGRMVAHVQVLAAPDALDTVAEACFRETTTLGLRTQIVRRRTLARRDSTMTAQGRALRVKHAARPGGDTAKVEADDLRETEGHAARDRLRRAAEDGADG